MIITQQEEVFTLSEETNSNVVWVQSWGFVSFSPPFFLYAVGKVTKYLCATFPHLWTETGIVSLF